MTIAVGDTFPAITVQTCDGQGAPAPLDLANWIANRKVVIFGLPGAFTPTCSAKHLPGFVEKAEELKAQGIDAIGCHAVNDAFVMAAWFKATGTDGVAVIADGAGALTKELGLELDLTMAGMGMRSKRYAMVIDQGVVTYLGVEPGQDFGVSSAETVAEVLAS